MSRKNILIGALTAILVGSFLAYPVRAARLVNIRTESAPGQTVVVLELDQPAAYKISCLDNKLIIDVPETFFACPSATFQTDSGLVARIRSSQFSWKPPVARVVIDLTAEAGEGRYKDLTQAGDKTIRVAVLAPDKKPAVAPEIKPPVVTENKTAPSIQVKTEVIDKPQPKMEKIKAAPPKDEWAEIKLSLGSSKTLDLPGPASNIAVGDPAVADFVIISSKELLLNGKKEGATNLTIWYSWGKKVSQVVVSKQPESYLTKNFKLSNISLEKTQYDGQLVTTKTDETMFNELERVFSSLLSKDKYSINTRLGTVTVQGTPEDIKAAEKLLAKIDLPRPQVIIEAQVIEINKTAAAEIGLTWIGQAGKTIGSFSTNATSPPQIYSNYPKAPGLDPATGKTGVQVDPVTGLPLILPSPDTVGETIPKTIGPVYAPFPGGVIDDSYKLAASNPISALGAGGGIIYDSRSTAASMLMAQLSALESDGKARLLANPRLVVLDGQTSLILVGQKVPVINHTVEGTTVQYIEIGVKLAITPRIGDKGEINTWLRTEASSISGYVGDYPLISSREAEAEVRLKEGQTLVIGGLLQTSDNKTDTKVPLLGDLPILGFLFRGKVDKKAETEIVITITPHLIGDR